MTKLVITDEEGSKKVFEGTLEGFVVKIPKKKFTNAVISGLDDTWIGKKVLCILIDKCYSIVPDIAIDEKDKKN